MARWYMIDASVKAFEALVDALYFDECIDDTREMFKCRYEEDGEDFLDDIEALSRDDGGKSILKIDRGSNGKPEKLYFSIDGEEVTIMF